MYGKYFSSIWIYQFNMPTLFVGQFLLAWLDDAIWAQGPIDRLEEVFDTVL
jgi:hypothetical protein